LKEEDKLKVVISKGRDAKEWLEHPAFRHVITLREAELFATFRGSKHDEQEFREEIWRKSQALATVKADLERVIRDANKASVKLEELNSK